MPKGLKGSERKCSICLLMLMKQQWKVWKASDSRCIVKSSKKAVLFNLTSICEWLATGVLERIMIGLMGGRWLSKAAETGTDQGTDRGKPGQGGQAEFFPFTNTRRIRRQTQRAAQVCEPQASGVVHQVSMSPLVVSDSKDVFIPSRKARNLNITIKPENLKKPLK